MAMVEANYNDRRSALVADATSARGSVATAGVSRLSQMQARFQQKQLQEKEQKLLQLYESQQLRAFQRVGRGSAGSSSVSSTTSSTTSSSSLGNGKVRQLFDERRTLVKPLTRTAGWDRSYPLEPLDNNHPRPRVVNQYNGHQRITRGASLDRINVEPIKQGVSRSKSQVRPGNLVNGDHLDRSYRRPPRHHYADEDYNYSQDDLNSSYYRDKNYNRVNNSYYQEREVEPLFTKSHHISTDFDEPLRNGEVFDQSQLFKKLTNVGGILLMKERTMNEDRYKTYNAGSRRGGAGATKQPLGTRRENDASSAPSKMMTNPAIKTKSVTNVSPTNGSTVQRASLLKAPGSLTSPTRQSPGTTNMRGSARPSDTPVRGPPQVSPRGPPPPPVSARGPPPPPVSARGAPPAPVSARGPPPVAQTSARGPAPSGRSPAASTVSSLKGGPSARQSVRGGAPSNNPDLRNCRICGRHFASDRIDMHQEICAKTAQKKRKTFDPLKQRIQGTEAEAFVRVASKKQPPKVKKADWRRKHEDFINTIRAAKGMQAHIAAGGKLSDLPPPPPSDYSDYVQCPHCGRKFNDAAAERHIPRCATMQHNKPKPAKGGPARKY